MHLLLTKHFFLKPQLEIEEIPLFSTFFNSSSENFTKDRSWMLHILLHGLFSQEDVKMFRKRHLIEILCTFFHSSACDNYIRKLILQIFSKMMSIPMGFKEMIQSGTVSWFGQMLARFASQRVFVFEILDLLNQILVSSGHHKIEYLAEELAFVCTSVISDLKRHKQYFTEWDLQGFLIPLLKLANGLSKMKKLKSSEGFHFVVSQSDFKVFIECLSSFSASENHYLKCARKLVKLMCLTDLEFDIYAPDEAVLDMVHWAVLILKNILLSASDLTSLKSAKGNSRLSSEEKLLFMFLTWVFSTMRKSEHLVLAMTKRLGFMRDLCWFYELVPVFRRGEKLRTELNVVMLVGMMLAVEDPPMTLNSVIKFAVQHVLPSLMDDIAFESNEPLFVSTNPSSQWVHLIMEQLLQSFWIGGAASGFVDMIGLLMKNHSSRFIQHKCAKEMLILGQCEAAAYRYQDLQVDMPSEITSNILKQHNAKIELKYRIVLRSIGG
jgi:hypothetical protein